MANGWVLARTLKVALAGMQRGMGKTSRRGELQERVPMSHVRFWVGGHWPLSRLGLGNKGRFKSAQSLR